MEIMGQHNGATWSTSGILQMNICNNCTATDDIVVTVTPLPTIDLGGGTDTTLDGFVDSTIPYY